MKFKAIVLASGKTATGIQVPDEIVNSLRAGKRPPVRITIKGHTYRSSVASMGGTFMVGISAENREKAGVGAGDTIEVNIELDTEAREVKVPPDLTAALEHNMAAKKIFYQMSYSHKLRHIYAIEQAKTPETRQRRIEKAIIMLREGK